MASVRRAGVVAVLIALIIVSNTRPAIACHEGFSDWQKLMRPQEYATCVLLHGPAKLHEKGEWDASQNCPPLIYNASVGITAPGSPIYTPGYNLTADVKYSVVFHLDKRCQMATAQARVTFDKIASPTGGSFESFEPFKNAGCFGFKCSWVAEGSVKLSEGTWGMKARLVWFGKEGANFDARLISVISSGWQPAKPLPPAPSPPPYVKYPPPAPPQAKQLPPAPAEEEISPPPQEQAAPPPPADVAVPPPPAAEEIAPPPPSEEAAPPPPLAEEAAPPLSSAPAEEAQPRAKKEEAEPEEAPAMEALPPLAPPEAEHAPPPPPSVRD